MTSCWRPTPSGSHAIALTNAKESFQLQRCVGYLDRAKRTLAIGIETDQKMLLARFETMVRQTRMKQVSARSRCSPAIERNSAVLPVRQ